MGFRFNKRIKIMPGLTMNVSKSGIGYTAGGKGVRVTKRADGRVTRTISAPGTGLSHTRTISGGSARTSTHAAAPRPTRPTVVTPPPPPRPPQPGVLAPRWEKDLFAETSNSCSVDYAQVAAKHPDAPGLRVLCATLEGLWHFTRLDTGNGDPRRARALLGWAAANGSGDLGRHPFVTKYLAERTWPVEIAGGVIAHLVVDLVQVAREDLVDHDQMDPALSTRLTALPSLVMVAAVYFLPPEMRELSKSGVPFLWAWPSTSWRPLACRVEELVIATAMTLAALEIHDRPLSLVS